MGYLYHYSVNKCLQHTTEINPKGVPLSKCKTEKYKSVKPLGLSEVSVHKEFKESNGGTITIKTKEGEQF